MRSSTSLSGQLTLLFVTLVFTAAASAATSVVKLRCESKVDPIGIDVAKPQLSWQITSDERGQRQTAYRIKTATNPDTLRKGEADSWDSGWVDGDQSVNVTYTGPMPADGERCYWSVTIKDRDGHEITSQPALWEIAGPLALRDARWLEGPTTQPTTKKPNEKFYPANSPAYFRKSFDVNQSIARARLYITALGLYRCSINGTAVGDAVLAPDFTEYHKRVCYQTYDVTPMIHQGQNVIGAIVADGWYSGHVAWLAGHAYGDRPALLAKLVIEHADGTQTTANPIVTDATWKTTNGPIEISDLLWGEDYDARKEMPGWDRLGFDDSAWIDATPRELEPAPELDAQVGPPVRKLTELPVKSVTMPGNGFICDFGQNMVGFVRLKTSGATAGQKVTLRFAEMLNPDGTIYTENLRTARATDSYICKGGEETWEPHFTFHGFRYVEVTGYPGAPLPDALTGIVIGSDCPPTGTFECSNSELNKLQSNIVWGQRGNYVSIPTDCPQRDERMGWMGDAQVFIRTATFNADVHEFFDNWLVDVSDAQSPNGAYGDISPRPLHTAGDGVAAWADAGVICPWQIYQAYGDTRILARQYDSMAKFIEYLRHNSDHLIRPAKGYGDWLSIAANTPKDVLATAYFAYSTHLMSQIATVLGKTDDAAKYEQLFNDIKKAFNDKFVSADGRIQGNTQTCYLIALKFELLDEANQQRAVQYLVDDIKAKNWHLSTGFVGVSYLLPILTQFGHTDVAYRLINQDTFPSWLFSVKQGATTIWERWDGWTPDKGFQTPKMNSFNHYSLGSCGQWMYDTIGGIGLDPEHPGYKHILIHPRPGGGVRWARCSYDSQYGPIKTDWKLADDKRFTLRVTIPPNTTSTVFMPTNDASTVTESGQPVDHAAGVKLSGSRDGESMFEVESGSYEFSSR
jgi:alpha-L-rhamnosidase